MKECLSPRAQVLFFINNFIRGWKVQIGRLGICWPADRLRVPCAVPAALGLPCPPPQPAAALVVSPLPPPPVTGQPATPSAPSGGSNRYLYKGLLSFFYSKEGYHTNRFHTRIFTHDNNQTKLRHHVEFIKQETYTRKGVRVPGVPQQNKALNRKNVRVNFSNL